MYVEVDATGVPMVADELAGRKGKQEDGSSKTREAKLGCVFTQTKPDEETGLPVRDPDSTTYVGSFETAEEFGGRIRLEALRRGLGRALKVVFLGDGAAWIWDSRASISLWPFGSSIFTTRWRGFTNYARGFIEIRVLGHRAWRSNGNRCSRTTKLPR